MPKALESPIAPGSSGGGGGSSFPPSTTQEFTGGVTTTPISLPTVAGKDLVQAFIECASDQTASRRLEYNVAGEWFRLKPGESHTVPIPSEDGIKQIQLRSVASTTSYQVRLVVLE